MATYCEICGKKLNDDTAQAGTRYICLACWNGKSAPRDTEDANNQGTNCTYLCDIYGCDHPTPRDTEGGE